MELTTDEQQQLEYCQEIKGFLSSDAWKEYAWPQIMNLINLEFPKPDGSGWEDKYRHAYTLVESANTLHSFLKSFSDKVEYYKNRQSKEEENIDLA